MVILVEIGGAVKLVRMRSTQFFHQIFGLDTPWSASRVDLDMAAKPVVVRRWWSGDGGPAVLVRRCWFGGLGELGELGELGALGMWRGGW